MTKGLHKNSLRKVDNPHQWMIDDARMELIQQIKAEVERKKDYALEHYQNQGDIQSAYNLCKELISFLSDLEKEEKPNSTNWEQIEKRTKESEKALDYMREHPLTHEQAVEQAQRLKEEEKSTTAEELEEEMERFMSNLTEKKGVFPPLTRLGFKAIARHFYELGRQSKKRELLPMIERICVSCPEKVKAESGLDEFTSKHCVHCSIEHCPGVKACYTSSNKQLQ